MKKLPLASALALPLAVIALAGPARGADPEPNKSLGAARLGIIKGTSPGIEIIPAGKKAQAPAPAASAASAAASPAVASSATAGTAKSPSTAAAPATTKPLEAVREAAAARFSEPVSGDSLGSAKRLTSPALGIPLPTKADKPQGAASAPAKP
jgi:hypothetical protein